MAKNNFLCEKLKFWPYFRVELEINLQQRMMKAGKPQSQRRIRDPKKNMAQSNNLQSLAQKWRLVKESLEKQNQNLRYQKVVFIL